MNAIACVTTAFVFASALMPYGVLAQGQVDAVQFQRLLHPASSMRLYTINQAEISRITAKGEWQREGTEGWLFPSPVVGTTPLYRLYLNKDGKHPDHLYTANRDEGNQVIKTWGVAYEGIAGYVATTQTPGTTPLLRLYNPQAGHFYTINAEEAASAVAKYGYVAEGQVGYVWTGPAALASVMPPPVAYRRIAGVKYLDLDRQDTKDSVAADRGYACVVHNPGCGWVGNAGSDRFFAGVKQLPIGARLSTFEYTPYWPKGLKCEDAGGLGKSGSYGQRIADYSPMSIGWENACQGEHAGKNVYYTISFIVAMEVGTDLGEETFDSRGTAGSNLPPCAPDDYASACMTAPPTPPTLSEYQATLVSQIPWEGYIPYTGVFPPPGVVYTGRPAEEWEVEKFSNPNAFPIFIFKPGMAATKCFAQEAGITLQTWGSTSATELYDVKTLHAPIALMACVASGTLVPNAIAVNVSYRH
jgi:Repeat of unknown function (DUF5648)